MLEYGEILSNRQIKGDYFRVEFKAPGICPLARAGQFVHVRICELRDKILRRPFSICDAGKDGVLAVVYKIVGGGTEMLAKLRPGAACDLMGPLGNGFTPPSAGRIPVIVAGGYGSAATYMIARDLRKGILLLGARSGADLILADEVRRTGFEVRIATEDGTVGRKGLVTDLLKEIMLSADAGRSSFYACGPHGMLVAVGKMLQEHNLEGELSLDHVMCCGVGACFACVQKIKDTSSPTGWRYARTCKEGPVFKASQIWYG